MSYTLGVPTDGQSLGNSKPQVRTNFIEIFNKFAVNHVDFNTLPGAGKHNFIQMPEVADKVTIDNEIGLYCKEAQDFSNLFWRQETGGADPEKDQGAIIQMTNVLPLNAQQGSSFLPGGLLIQWDTGTLSGGGATKDFTFARPFSLAGVAASPWSIVVGFGTTPGNSTTVGVETGSVDETGFTAKGVGFGVTGSTVYYIAIGPRT